MENELETVFRKFFAIPVSIATHRMSALLKSKRNAMICLLSRLIPSTSQCVQSFISRHSKSLQLVLRVGRHEGRIPAPMVTRFTLVLQPPATMLLLS